MTGSKKQQSNKHDSASPDSPKVELDRIEIPTATSDPPVPASPEKNEAPLEKESPEKNPVAELQPAISPDTPKDGETTPQPPQKNMRFFLTVLAGITAAVWILTGMLFFFYWMFLQ